MQATVNGDLGPSAYYEYFLRHTKWVVCRVPPCQGTVTCLCLNPAGGGPTGHLPRGGGHFPPYVFPNIFEMSECIKTKFNTQQDEYLRHVCTNFCVLLDVRSGHGEVRSPIMGSGFAVSV